MGNTTLSIPIELVLDVLQRCGRHDIYNFARTSRANYDISVHMLYRHIDLAVALDSTALERHEKYGVYDFVQIVDLPIGFSSPEFFTCPATDDPVSEVQEALLRFKNIRELHLIIAEEEYSTTCPTARILRWVLSDYAPRLSALFLEIYCCRPFESKFVSVLKDLATEKDASPEHNKLKTIKVWVTHCRPRKLISYLAPLLSPFVASLENIEIRARCDLDPDAAREWWIPGQDYQYLKSLESKSIKSAIIEDKNLSITRATCQFVAKFWPNLVELELDLGANHYVEQYRRLSRLRNLQKLAIMFPYHSWHPEVQAHMGKEAEYPATILGEKIPTLQEVSIKYIGGDCSTSQTAVFDFLRTKSDPDEHGSQSEVVAVNMRELWSEKGDYEDIICIMKLVREMGCVLLEEARERIERYILVDELKVDGFEISEEDNNFRM
ncbi:hypothetical protein TWF718_003782 [Orbilia javanica]|uniref:F-box domain-containing protein n=1 Tax=Orbilia javanica TaxID=47235 RepID=A0AAN8N5C3_9PEZI